MVGGTGLEPDCPKIVPAASYRAAAHDTVAVSRKGGAGALTEMI
jgi:hypothetical protein